MDFIFNAFLTIVYYLIFNGLFIICCLIGLFLVRRGKTWGWYRIGVVLQGLSMFGCISGMVREPDVWLTSPHIISLVISVALIVLFFFVTRTYIQKYNGASQQEDSNGQVL
ncbi:MAG: hypothetical protein VB071_08980 [Lawsonibacter sp.]|nr:hypothetical protein [Lawsonibacter sp.]